MCKLLNLLILKVVRTSCWDAMGTSKQLAFLSFFLLFLNAKCCVSFSIG